MKFRGLAGDAEFEALLRLTCGEEFSVDVIVAGRYGETSRMGVVNTVRIAGHRRQPDETAAFSSVIGNALNKA